MERSAERREHRGGGTRAQSNNTSCKHARVGGVTPAVTALLRRLDKRSCADTTRYGEHSTHDFYGHHAAAISLAIVTGEAEAVVSGVSRRETALAGGEHRG